jgi:phenylalanyl-tRNA synthetase beta chain
VSRDVALIVKNEIPSQRIISIINKIGGDIINKVKFFDQYLGEQIPHGFRSLAYSIEYHAKERTLEDEEVNKIHSLICKGLSEELGAQIR